MEPQSLKDLGELYHDYSLFGFQGSQKPGIFGPNQRCKAPIITAYIQLAIAKCRVRMDDEVTFSELFCADGYFAMVARHLGASRCQGIDNNRDGYLSLAPTIASRLGLGGIEFLEMDVEDVGTLEPTDIVANVGGLYHVENPEEILIKSYELARRYLIVQSVVSLASRSPDYLQTPAPGWTWGSRYSRESFDAMVERLGYDIVDRHFNELEGNERPEDRGSVYYLIDAQR